MFIMFNVINIKLILIRAFNITDLDYRNKFKIKKISKSFSKQTKINFILYMYVLKISFT